MSTMEDILSCITFSLDWLSVKDIAKKSNRNENTIARLLRKRKDIFKSKKIANNGKKGWQLKMSPGATNQPISGMQMNLSFDVLSKPSLFSAVVATVNDFVDNNKKFSAFEITVAVRNQASKSTISISPAETGVVYVSGKAVPNIQHANVREIVHEMFRTKLMKEYSYKSNGTHIVYEPPVIDGVDVATGLSYSNLL